MDGGAQDLRGEGAILKLYLALGIASGDVTAFVGSGGKSSAILAVAGELAEAGMTFLAALADVVLVEADGSRRRPIKGTADHEPALPDAATLVVAVGNIGAFGAPVDEENVHRPELFSKLTGIGAGQSITARAFALALAQGSLGDLPGGARPAALITGVRPGKSMADASVITRELWRFGVKKVVLSSLPGES